MTRQWYEQWAVLADAYRDAVAMRVEREAWSSGDHKTDIRRMEHFGRLEDEARAALDAHVRTLPVPA